MRYTKDFLIELYNFIRQDECTLYRKSFRTVNDEIRFLNLEIIFSFDIGDSHFTCLKLTNIEVSSEHRNKGIASNLIELTHNLNPYQVTVIWCVVSTNLENHLRKNGWSIVPNGQTSAYDWYKFT